MKHIVPLTLITVIACAVFWGCNAGGRNGPSSEEETISKDSSYALGMDLGNSLKMSNIIPNMDEFIKGINDILTDSDTRYSQEEAQMLVMQMFQAMDEERRESERLEENEFLAENSSKPGIVVTSTGLQYEVLSEGTGPKPDYDSMVRVHYEGSLTSGVVFDSSYSRGQPAEFPLGQVIAGWTEGLQLMNVGSKYRLYVPSDLGYGPMGREPTIPPYSTLIFEVELLDIIQ
jgi:FKBP-type peptidyl-prolyl cis-trans isomerase